MRAGIVGAAKALFRLALFDPCSKNRKLLIEFAAAAMRTFPFSGFCPAF
jgi:hypothetical protein